MDKNITIIGTGNVAYHLCEILIDLKYNISLYGRNELETLNFEKKFNVRKINNFNDIQHQFVIVCISDSNINTVVEKLASNNKIIFTSGTVSLNEIVQKDNLGVFYPLQTFSKERKINWFEIPILIEANNEYFTQEIFNFAWEISKKVEYANSEKRKFIHIAAVFSSNFVNHLLQISKNFLEEKDIDWKILFPLINETIDKALSNSPYLSQTGPARRNDTNTLENHKKELKFNPLEIYNVLTKSILETYNHEKL